MISVIVYSSIIMTAICAVYLGIMFGGGVPISKQLDIYSSLRAVSTVIFGVMGAWLAIIYPDSLKKVFYKKYSVGDLSSNLKRVFFPMRVATFIVIATLIIEWFSPILHQVPFLKERFIMVRTCSFLTLTALVLVLLWSLVLTLIPMENAEREVSAVGEILNQEEKRKGRTKKRSPPPPEH